ncbi:hypothetical protein ACFWAY_51955 [Rhodococcus sp. NPDC059968]|uniref:hypothetical protein n=1 Tax=Rhodococcus sp. NPDC059968 TaxID=3347017 RepID=UPI00366EFD19
MSIALRTLSVAAFWVIGLGFVLAAAAIACGAITTSRSPVADDEAASLRALLRALLGVVAGVAGVIVSAIALFPSLRSCDHGRGRNIPGRHLD